MPPFSHPSHSSSWVLEGKKENRRWPCCPQTSPSIKAEVHSDCSGHYKTSQKHQAGPKPCCSAQLTTTQRAQPGIQPAKRRFHHGEVPKPALSTKGTFPAGRAQRSASCSCSWGCFLVCADSSREAPAVGGCRSSCSGTARARGQPGTGSSAQPQLH